MLRQRIVALAMTRTHACFENCLRVFNAPTEPRRLAKKLYQHLETSQALRKGLDLSMLKILGL